MLLIAANHVPAIFSRLFFSTVSQQEKEEEGNEESHFVHSTGCIDKINDGDAVEFDVKEGRKGMNAVDVKLVQE